MPQVRVSTTVAPTSFPAGTTVGQFRFRLSKGGSPAYTQYIDPPLPAEVVFENVAAGDYTLTISRLSATGTPLVGGTYTTTLTVLPDPPVLADLPVGAVVTVA